MPLSCESDTAENTVHRQAAKQTKIQNARGFARAVVINEIKVALGDIYCPFVWFYLYTRTATLAIDFFKDLKYVQLSVSPKR